MPTTTQRTTATHTQPTLPKHAGVETPDQVYADWIAHGERMGFSPKRAHALARDRCVAHQIKMLGHFHFLTESAGHFMAASLRQKRMPAGAQRWVAQQCLEAWLPHMNTAERAGIVATLRECTPEQLGPDLVAVIAQEPADV